MVCVQNTRDPSWSWTGDQGSTTDGFGFPGQIHAESFGAKAPFLKTKQNDANTTSIAICTHKANASAIMNNTLTFN